MKIWDLVDEIYNLKYQNFADDIDVSSIYACGNGLIYHGSSVYYSITKTDAPTMYDVRLRTTALEVELIVSKNKVSVISSTADCTTSQVLEYLNDFKSKVSSEFDLWIRNRLNSADRNKKLEEELNAL